MLDFSIAGAPHRHTHSLSLSCYLFLFSLSLSLIAVAVCGAIIAMSIFICVWANHAGLLDCRCTTQTHTLSLSLLLSLSLFSLSLSHRRGCMWCYNCNEYLHMCMGQSCWTTRLQVHHTDTHTLSLSLAISFSFLSLSLSSPWLYVVL